MGLFRRLLGKTKLPRGKQVGVPIERVIGWGIVFVGRTLDYAERARLESAAYGLVKREWYEFCQALAGGNQAKCRFSIHVVNSAEAAAQHADNAARNLKAVLLTQPRTVGLRDTSRGAGLTEKYDCFLNIYLRADRSFGESGQILIAPNHHIVPNTASGPIDDLEPLLSGRGAPARTDATLRYATATVKIQDDKRAAEEFELGEKIYRGQETARDDGKAAQHYRRAAEMGHASAQRRLGTMYEGGTGVVQDYRAAAMWYRKAAEQGDARAQYYLGLLYEKGQGVVGNLAEAATWFRLAADQRDEDAREKMRMYHLR